MFISAQEQKIIGELLDEKSSNFLNLTDIFEHALNIIYKSINLCL